MTTLETIYTPIGSYAPDFELPGIDEQVHHLGRYLEKFRAVAVVAMSNQCPYVDLYIERLKNIQAEFGTLGFTLIGMNGNDANTHPQESFENMKGFAKIHELNFPYLWDSTQDVVQSFGVSRTPTAFLIDGDGIVRYKGRIDDNPHNSPEVVEQHHLKRAITALFQGEKIEPVETEPFGTSLTWRK